MTDNEIIRALQNWNKKPHIKLGFDYQENFAEGIKAFSPLRNSTLKASVLYQMVLNGMNAEGTALEVFRTHLLKRVRSLLNSHQSHQVKELLL